MKAKGEGMGKEHRIGYEDTSISLSLNIFLLCHELSSKELKLFLGLYTSYVTLVRNVMEFMRLLFFGKKMNGSLKEFLDELISLLYCNKELSGFSPLKEMEHQSDVVIVDYGVNLLMTFDLIPLSIDHALRFGEVKKIEYFKYIHLRNHATIATSTRHLKRID
ncbi:hypothetical protein M9H77_30785 [Catharanthus roseus]|uniref:Uncharacterized protein n=1 Tax=Catharanthus roseus TaxID=4058 RepID=A0ACC0A0I3_CATRO|nr:hypothetical protein M9H77_30785 [Catharanthus roseus]